MSIELAINLGEQALLTALLVASPLLMAALVVGTLISVLQAVTQVQEVTLVFVPKIIAVFLMIGVAGAWMLQMAVSFGTNIFLLIPDM